MARIRSVKPELRTSLTASQWPREIRYFWVLLWGYLDDHGYGVDEPRLIKPDCFPLDDDISVSDIDKWLDLIAHDGSLCRFRGPDGRRYLHAPKWAEHQRPQHPAVPKYPACTLSHESHMNGSGESHEGLSPEGVVEGVVEGGGVAVARETRVARDPRNPASVTLLGNSLLDEHRRQIRPSLPRDVARKVHEHIESLLDDSEISVDDIREGLRRLRSNRKFGPGMLPNLVHEYRQEQAGEGAPARASPAGKRQQETDELFDEALARARAQDAQAAQEARR